MKKISDHITSIAGKNVLVRCNFDVPIENSEVVDTTRIEDSISTIKLLREHNCSVRLLSHQGRPENGFDQSHSLEPVRRVLEKLLNESVSLIAFEADISNSTIPTEGISLFENLRFWQGETANDADFAQKISTFGEVYVNQAFANCHRKHASMVALPQLLPAYAGVNLANEVEVLLKVRNNPDSPLIVIIGGAKLETKEPLVEVFSKVADKILVGGKIAVDIREKGVQMPENVVVANLVESGKDITRESAQEFANYIASANSIMWNGTMGVFEEEMYQSGTRIIADAIHKSSAYKIVGGGDTETALTVLDLEDTIDFISTGGGAMLSFLSEGALPALEVLA